MRGTGRVVERKQGGVKPRKARAKNQKSKKNLKFSLRGSVEIQAQHWPDRLNKPRAGLDEDQSSRLGPERWTESESHSQSRIKEPDPRGAGRPFEAYAPRLVGS